MYIFLLTLYCVIAPRNLDLQSSLNRSSSRRYALRRLEVEESTAKCLSSCSVADGLARHHIGINPIKRVRFAHCRVDDELIRQEIYSRHCNMVFYRVPETPDEDCTGLVRKIIVNDLKIKREEVSQFQFCGVHCLGKQSCGRPRPIIAQFTHRNDCDKDWKMHRNLKDSNISIGEDLPKRVQDIKKKILVPAMKKARSLDPRNKATVIGDKLVVNGKQYLHFNIPKLWLDNQPSIDSNKEPVGHDGVMPLNATSDQEPTTT